MTGALFRWTFNCAGRSTAMDEEDATARHAACPPGSMPGFPNPGSRVGTTQRRRPAADLRQLRRWRRPGRPRADFCGTQEALEQPAVTAPMDARCTFSGGSRWRRGPRRGSDAVRAPGARGLWTHQTSARVPHRWLHAAATGRRRPDTPEGPLPSVSAGQRPFHPVWQVKDSNLRRYTPTDLQSAWCRRLTWADAHCRRTSARIRHRRSLSTESNRQTLLVLARHPSEVGAMGSSDTSAKRTTCRHFNAGSRRRD